MTTKETASVRWIKFPQYDQNGTLTVFEGQSKEIPFSIARIFTIAGVHAGGERGNHAHRRCSQLLVCLSGTATILIKDGMDTVSFELNADGMGLLVPPGLWNTVVFNDPLTVLLVLCDEAYDPADYIRDWNEYLLFTRG